MFGRKQISDAEYVEQIRKRDRSIRRMSWIWPILLLAMVYLLIRLGDIIQEFSVDFSVEKKMVYAGLLLGVVFGFILNTIAHYAGNFIKHWIDARQGFRTERLMLKYHDELREKDASNNASEPTSLRSEIQRQRWEREDR